MNKTHLTRRVEKMYFEIIEDMAKYFESSEEEIKNTFLDPLKVKFTPAQLHAEWWTSQIALMVKANKAKKREIILRVATLLALQEILEMEIVNEPRVAA